MRFSGLSSTQYKTTKKSINYNENNKKLPEDFNLEILDYSIGTFSDLVYKDNNIYRINGNGVRFI